jgi:hypothetical protein
MDFQGQMLACAEYELSNQMARKASRTELLAPRERRFKLPRVLTHALGIVRLRAMIDGIARAAASALHWSPTVARTSSSRGNH